MSSTPEGPQGLASIVVPCFNQLAYTRTCLAALARRTRGPWELIVVDDGSTDGTGRYLEGFRDAAPFPVTVLSEPVNCGFPAACNRGLAAARGDYLVLLNNDAVVADDWLDQLVALAESSPRIGAVGPMSNFASPPQLVADVPYGDDLEAMRRYAEDRRRTRRGRWFTAPKLSGFCVLVKRRAFEAVGPLDERFGPGLFDDDDWSLRIRKAGFDLAVADDLFVHHFGGRTFLGAGIDSERLLAENLAKFRAKWGDAAPVGRTVQLPLGSPAAASRHVPKVFGIGLPRTGTTSVSAALLELGLRTAHAVFDDVAYDRGDAFLDTPVYVDYPTLDRRFPGSKFVLTWREPRAWFRSFATALGPHLQRLRAGGEPDSPSAAIDRRCYAAAFGDEPLEEEAFVRRYQEHRARAEAHFRGRPGDLLVLDLDASPDPWGELCGFLGRPRPATPFPRLNAGAVDQWMPLRHPNKLASAPPAGAGARVSLTMIVRDEEANLPACLESARGLFDEVVVVDTGSTDRTVEVARSFGARVFDFAWVDDFAAARNAALARATGDYAFWLDADDRVEPPHRERLERLFRSLRPDGPAYVVRCACDPDPDGGGATVVDHVRLFPIREDVRWTYRVHEQILPALRRAGVDVRWTDAVVRHVGYNDPAVRRRKLDRDRAILESEAAERPDDPFVLFNLGQLDLEVGDPRGALGHLRASLAGSTPADSITSKLHALIARAHQVLGEPDAALAACAAGLADEPDDVELLFRKGVLHRLGGDAASARACWERILTVRRPEKFASVDESLFGWATHRNLAVLAEERGDLAEARGRWEAVRVARPGDPEPAQALERIERFLARGAPA
ncbi:glycosyltransferase [Paludisphaera rhizosphaerae]|uniref:glycosyltransferase n=1 Tax=Paludisphaera rhizosphaerae TaxID=2711216 RepID=UPI0028F3EE92|nr:glycosyltransferase [Paludisphaera rhizosphaerae]